MVHALEEVYRLLRPDGYLIEIHPILEPPVVKVFGGSTLLFAGPYPGYDYEEDLHQAENAIQRIIQRGLFAISGTKEFDFMTYGSTLTEIQDLWEEPAQARDAEFYKQIEEHMNTAGKVANVALHERVRLTRLKPIAELVDILLSELKVSGTGYFVYCNANTDKEAVDGKLEFDIKIIPYQGDTFWVEGTILEAIECLKSDKLPSPGSDCDFCKYRRAVRQVVSQFET